MSNKKIKNPLWDNELNIEKRLVKIGTLILCFEPNLIIFSGGLLREAWVEFFTTISLFYFFVNQFPFFPALS